MNDYLKNQLVKQDHYSVRYLSNKVEAGLANAADLQTQQMLEEIEYLKQANKHKEKQMEAIRRKKVKEIKEGDLKQLMLASLSTLNTMQTPKKKLSRRELSKSANTCETMVLTKPTKRKASKNQCRLCYSRSVM